MPIPSSYPRKCSQKASGSAGGAAVGVSAAGALRLLGMRAAGGPKRKASPSGTEAFSEVGGPMPLGGGHRVVCRRTVKRRQTDRDGGGLVG